MDIKLLSGFKPKGDQPQAIQDILKRYHALEKHSVLLGATGTGKTFTMANIIEKLNVPTLVLAHNKTLAHQLFYELKQFFPKNRVEYFVSNFDFYQPEAYLPKNDVYINKVAHINQKIQMSRLSTLNALTTRKDVIVIASVAAIYGEFNPADYKKLFFEIRVGQNISRLKLSRRLVASGYTRSFTDLQTKSFQFKGENLILVPGWTTDYYVKIAFYGDEITSIKIVDSLNRTTIDNFVNYTVFPATDYMLTKDRVNESIARIKFELAERYQELLDSDKEFEARRLLQITENDLEEISEFHTCNGIENYSRHLELRPAKEPPYTLLDYFGDDWLLIVDESHITLPQVKGMYNVDYSRKRTLVDYGFRLPSALDNRPLNFQEFNKKIDKALYLSATPANYELNLVENNVVEQLIRPTYLIDPKIYVYKKENQIIRILELIKEAIKNNERIFVVTLTIKTAEELSKYLLDNNIKATYLHNKLKTLERSKILYDLRRGIYDCVVGINLLREGLDLPEVALICILDADQQGFLRNDKSLIQIIGRAARNLNGRVVMFADKKTKAIDVAINETQRRRKIQQAYNIKHQVEPRQVVKELNNPTINDDVWNLINKHLKTKERITLRQQHQVLENIEKQMIQAAKELDFEKAAELRDLLFLVKQSKNKKKEKN